MVKFNGVLYLTLDPEKEFRVVLCAVQLNLRPSTKMLQYWLNLTFERGGHCNFVYLNLNDIIKYFIV